MLDIPWFLIFTLAAFSLISLKLTLTWLFLLQRKEYRLDKIKDYLSLPEAKGFILDKWTLVRFFWIIIVCLYIFLFAVFRLSSYQLVLNINIQIQVLLVLFVFFTWITESIKYFQNNIFGDSGLIPGFSTKAKILFTLTFLTLVSVGIGFIFIFNFSLFYVLFLNFFLLYTPLILGIWLFVITPFDRQAKFRIYQNAKDYRQSLLNLKVVAISGAYGKTSTKEALAHILASKYEVAKSQNYENTEIAVARRTLELNQEVEIFVAELGSYKIGESSIISEFIAPEAAIITGLNQQHYALFGSKENIQIAESESLNFLPANSPVALNWSSEMVRDLDLPGNLNYIKYGLSENIPQTEQPKVQVMVTNYKTNLQGTDFTLVIRPNQKVQSKTWQLKTNWLSKGNLENLAGAIALALQFGVNQVEIQKSLLNLPIIRQNLEVTEYDWGYKIDDSRNANFDGVKNAIEFLKESGVKEKVIFLDDILELGKLSVETHVEVAKVLAKNKINKIVLVGRNFAPIVKAVLIQEGFKEDSVIIWNRKNTPEIKQNLKSLLTLAGSRVKVGILFEGYQSRKFLDLV